MDYIFYDIEILECIPSSSEEPSPQFKYCGGWHDHEGMTPSCIAFYNSLTDCYKVGSLDYFLSLIPRDPCPAIIGFNSIGFDDKVLYANGIELNSDYDLLREIYRAKGLDPFSEKFSDEYKGYSLEKLAQANFGIGKTGSGSLAPQWWQQGKYEAVKMYCLNDVYLSVELLKRGWAGELIDSLTHQKLKLKPLE